MFSDNVLIGLDIGAHSIKMVEVKHGKNDLELQTFGMAYHSVNLDGYWDSTKLRQISVIVEEILKNNSFGGVRTVVGVQSKEVYVTTMDFEASWDKRQIQAEIEKQAPYFLPYPPDEMRLSWSVVPKDEQIVAYTGKQRVSINAMPDFIIENSKNLLEHINLDGVALENQTNSQVRANFPGDTGNTILVDVGAKQITFSMIIDGIPRSSVHIPTGVNVITQQLSESLGVDYKTAEFFKKDLHLINLFQLPKPALDFFKVIKSELSIFVELNRKISQPPAKIIFTGGGVYTAGFIEFFQSYAIPVFLANPLRQLKVSENFLPLISPVANQMSAAIGQAIRMDV